MGINIEDKAKQTYRLLQLDDNTKVTIFKRYSVLFSVYKSNNKQSLINSADSISPLLANNIINWILAERNSETFKKISKQYNNLLELFKSDSLTRRYIQDIRDTIEDGTGRHIGDYCSYDDLISSLSGGRGRGSSVDNNSDADSDNLEQESDFDYFQDEDSSTTGSDYEEQDISDTRGRIDEVSTDSEDEEQGEDENNQYTNIPDDAEEMLTAIVNRLEAVFKSCLELDRPYGMLYDKGLLSYKIEDGSLHYKPGADANGESIFERLYQAILSSAHANLASPDDLRCVPNSRNIGERDVAYNYYPGFMFKYALGIVDNKTYKNWGSFKDTLTKSIRGRLGKLVDADLFFGYQDIIENSFSNSILVLSYDKGSGIKLRISLPGCNINPNELENNIRNIRTYNNASIAITTMSGFNDVIDIQILMDEEKFLSKPYWAYQAMQVKINNKEKLSLSAGLPIGRKLNGEIVDFKMDPSSRFLTFIAAGSGAGKGVLTLSIVAAAIGSGIPVFYMDYKPDMAPIFWNLEDQLGINTFTYDAMVKHHRNEFNGAELGTGMPDEVRGQLGKFASAITYLKSVQLMCAMAKYRAGTESNRDIMFIFDETQAMQRLIKGAIEKTVELKREHKPKKVKGVEEEPDAVYNYCNKLLDWFKEVNTNIDTYVNTTGRASNTFCIFIAQNPDYSTWNNLVVEADGTKLQMLGRITVADTICKILGKGSTTSKYGLGGDGKKSITPKELSYVANNRFFGLYDGKTTDGADISIFKPFLTLNYDDPKDKCWTKGLGKMYGAGTVGEQAYIDAIKKDHPGEPGYTNQYGIHTGTGFKGLSSMYCNGDSSIVSNNLQSGWDYAIEFFNKTGLISKYANPTEYMYDISLDGLLGINDMVQYRSCVYTDESEDSDGNGDFNSEYYSDDIDTGWSVDGNNTEYCDEDYIDLNATDECDEQDGLELEGQDGLDFSDSLTAQQKIMINNKRAEEDSRIRVMTGDIESESIFDIADDIDTAPDIASADTKSTFTGGNTGKVIYINPSRDNNPVLLTDLNSIDCSVDDRYFLEKHEKAFYRGLSGTKYEFNRRWRKILESVSESINSNLVTSVAIVGQQMYVNDKILNMTNIVGGFADIKLENLVNLRELFKSFPNIDRLTIDFEIFNRLQLNDRNMPYRLFDYSKGLLYVTIISDNGATTIDKNKARLNRDNAMISNMSEISDLSSRIKLACAVKSKDKFRNASVGCRDIIWNTAKSYRDNGFRAAHRQLSKENPNIFSAALYATWGATVALAGGISYGIGSIIGRFIR